MQGSIRPPSGSYNTNFDLTNVQIDLNQTDLLYKVIDAISYTDDYTKKLLITALFNNKETKEIFKSMMKEVQTELYNEKFNKMLNE